MLLVCRLSEIPMNFMNPSFGNQTRDLDQLRHRVP